MEKLSTTEKLNKVVRNQYLMELARQIQSLELSPPFTSNPPLGMLQPLKHRFESKCKSDESKCENGIFLNKQAMCSRWCREISHNMTFFNQEAKNFHPKDISEQDNTENKAKILGKNIKSQNSHIPVKCDVKKNRKYGLGGKISTSEDRRSNSRGSVRNRVGQRRRKFLVRSDNHYR